MEKITMNQVVETLKGCKDPELDIDVVDIGLIYNIVIDQSNNIELTMTMTSPMCPVTSIILADAELRLEQIKDVGKVTIKLVWDPAWNPEMMSEEIRLQHQLF